MKELIKVGFIKPLMHNIPKRSKLAAFAAIFLIVTEPFRNSYVNPIQDERGEGCKKPPLPVFTL